ncbi:BTB/POZ domain-containing protein At2g30600 [Actinidia eriantha]|uniref:BTB/POZ domain-containing protein At2g30600 n=1 Tax=Actinidia eriantha TaxID=165200 RepID=UPI002584AA83|nr:BTB/POZ domain-containing protein At2g30600 [Actinidia eriantha]XP_057502788.1 BTB/POZ domain-containing protein At2g30600 [Actinidia eriantha]
MIEKNQKKFLTVAPFECAWGNNLRFREAGRGCVAFEAFAHNDVTVVFREHVGSQHYHYKRDNSPHYTVIIGSHRNRRLKIEVDGKTAVDVAGVGLCCSSAFQSYWISIYDGLISIGKGRYPFQNLVFQWLDSNPNFSVQYVGLSSWDKHVGYRNVNVLPLTQNHISLWKHVDYGEFEGKEDGEEEMENESGQYESWGLENFLESWELSDIFFVVGEEEKAVPAHKVILAASGNFGSSLISQVVIQLQDVSYPVLHAFLQYIYTGHTKILESQLSSLKALSLKYEVMALVKQCEEMTERFKLNKKLFDSGNNVEISYPSSRPHCGIAFPSGLPLNMQRLKQFHITGEYSDVDIYVGGHGLIAPSHKIILALWSVPFCKMFTNGMSESISSKVLFQDVPLEAFESMLEFMYCGELNREDTMDIGTLLLQLLLLADQFGVSLLHQECCKTFLECLSEDTVCPILQAILSVPSCKLIEETCERKFSMHFDYCTTASIDFVLLDEATFSSILKHPDLTVTSEERVLNAILLWCLQAKDLYGWDIADEMMLHSTPELLFGERFQYVEYLLPLVRFPLLPYPLLKKLERSYLSRKIPTFDFLVNEAVCYLESGLPNLQYDQNARFQHRRSSFKELQYICDGDSNGVFYFAGTSYGEHPWVNPVLAKRICISASSPISRHTDPKVLVSRAYQGTSFVGPRIEDEKNSAWWMIDIGQDHQLMCNYYTLRQDGSRAYIRCWNFQGSLDGKSWTNLRVHENDPTMCKPGQFASWPIIGPNALLPFRFFRVILNAPTTDESNPWNFCICFLELYGYFR